MGPGVRIPLSLHTEVERIADNALFLSRDSRVAERTKAPVSKAGGSKGPVGSNPTPTANWRFTMGRIRKKKPNNGMTAPTSLPFLEAVEKRLNVTVKRDNERMILANYEKNWALNGVLETVAGPEARFLRYLANKYHSFIASQI